MAPELTTRFRRGGASQQTPASRGTLRSGNITDGDAAKTIRIITARDEGAFYDGIYSKPPKFQTLPSALLAEALWGRGEILYILRTTDGT